MAASVSYGDAEDLHAGAVILVAVRHLLDQRGAVPSLFTCWELLVQHTVACKVWNSFCAEEPSRLGLVVRRPEVAKVGEGDWKSSFGRRNAEQRLSLLCWVSLYKQGRRVVCVQRFCRSLVSEEPSRLG